MSRAVPTLLIDNERVRVTEWRFAPGAATGWHRHDLDYVVVPMADGVLELVGPDGVRTRSPISRHGTE
jgi:quercetin dioxygenase-like cupin family protein